MTERFLYSDHLETIIALVTNLGMTRYKSRTPTALAKYLSLDKDEVNLVLQNFKGLFRESIIKSKKTNEPFYTLQLRYSRRWLEDDAEEQDEDAPDNQREPLEADYMATLLGFISEMVANEQAEKRQLIANRSATVGAWIAAGAAFIAAIIGIISISLNG
jgi:hypothetical protein